MKEFLRKLKEKIASMSQKELDESWKEVEDKSPNKFYFDDIKFYPNGCNIKNEPIKKCAYDMLDKEKPYGLYCSCPKCSGTC